MYLKCARNQQQQAAKIGNYGQGYADGNAVGVEHSPGAQGAATSPKMDQMVTNTPTALPSAYGWSRRRRTASVFVGPTAATPTVTYTPTAAVGLGLRRRQTCLPRRLLAVGVSWVSRSELTENYSSKLGSLKSLHVLPRV